MSIFWNVIELTATAFESYIIVSAITAIFGHRYAENKGKIIDILFMMAATGYVTLLNHFYQFEGMLSLTILLLYILYAVFFTNGRVINQVLTTVMLFSLVILINVSVTMCMSMVLGIRDTVIFTDSDGARLFALFLTKIIYFAVTRMIVHMYKKDFIELATNETLLMVAMFGLLFVICTVLIRLQMRYPEIKDSVFGAVLCALLLYVFVYYMLGKIARDNKDKMQIKLLETQLSEQRNLMEEAGQVHRDIKKTEHDLKHHLFSVLGMVKMGKTEDAEQYLESLLHNYEASVFRYIQLDNSAISSILNFKIGRCHSSNIDMKTEIETDFDGFSDTDICVLLANVLDNAIEASEKVSVPKILVHLWDDKGYLHIDVRNRIEQPVLTDNRELATTKLDKDKHGLGIYSISQIVNRYDGMKDHYEKGGYFITDIWLKRPEKNIR